MQRISHFPSRTAARLFCTKRGTSEVIDSCIRSSHASEIFRESFVKGAGGGVGTKSISSRDLDDLLLMKRTRPSILLPLFELGGLTLGIVSRATPLKGILTQVVDEATRTQLNDSIRDLTTDQGEPDPDTKETLKYHRELKISDENESHPAILQTPISLLQGAVYQTLKLSKNV